MRSGPRLTKRPLSLTDEGSSPRAQPTAPRSTPPSADTGIAVSLPLPGESPEQTKSLMILSQASAPVAIVMKRSKSELGRDWDRSRSRDAIGVRSPRVKYLVLSFTTLFSQSLEASNTAKPDRRLRNCSTVSVSHIFEFIFNLIKMSIYVAPFCISFQ